MSLKRHKRDGAETPLAELLSAQLGFDFLEEFGDPAVGSWVFVLVVSPLLEGFTDSVRDPHI